MSQPFGTMKPGGMHLAAMRSDGMVSGHGLAPSAASLRILEPEIEMKSSLRDASRVRMVWSFLS